uniref:14-3-3 domain-containing protein n=1 Tax=Leersia perrieri TaxID=77586 RepID=A0A0D9UY54_9ORYZ
MDSLEDCLAIIPLEDLVYIESREDLFYRAKLTVQAERYDEVVEAMNGVAKLDESLTVEERNLFAVGYKTLIDAKRASIRTLGSIEMEEETKGKERHARMAVEYRRKVEAVIDIIDKYLITHSSGAESSVFYYKMKGDYYRYLAEFKIGPKRNLLSDLSLKAYEAYKHALAKLAFILTASKTAETDLSPADPIRLSLALNISVFYNDIMNSPDKACRVAKHAVDEAVSEPHLVSDEKYNDSEPILRVLKSNLELWKSDMADDADLAPLEWTQVGSITLPIYTATLIAYGPPMAENKIDATVNGQSNPQSATPSAQMDNGAPTTTTTEEQPQAAIF